MSQAIDALRRCDPALAAIIDASAPPDLAPRPFATAFQPLSRSVVYQQLSGKAADTIFGRLASAFGDGQWPEAGRMLDGGTEALRAVGLSRQKVDYLLGLARAELAGEMPSHQTLLRMEDEEIVEVLTAYRGIGRWTVEMLLIFWLQRPDILPVDDLGIRKGIQRIDALEALPAPAAVAPRGELWRPYRSIASWYLWRAAEAPVS